MGDVPSRALHACLPLLTTGALVSRSTLCTSGAAYVLVAAEAPRWCGSVAPPPAARGRAPPPLLLSQPPLFARTTTTLRARGGQAGAGRQDAAAQVRMVTSARQRPQWHLVRAQGQTQTHKHSAGRGPSKRASGHQFWPDRGYGRFYRALVCAPISALIFP